MRRMHDIVLVTVDSSRVGRRWDIVVSIKLFGSNVKSLFKGKGALETDTVGETNQGASAGCAISLSFSGTQQLV